MSSCLAFKMQRKAKAPKVSVLSDLDLSVVIDNAYRFLPDTGHLGGRKVERDPPRVGPCRSPEYALTATDVDGATPKPYPGQTIGPRVLPSGQSTAFNSTRTVDPLAPAYILPKGVHLVLGSLNVIKGGFWDDLPHVLWLRVTRLSTARKSVDRSMPFEITQPPDATYF